MKNLYDKWGGKPCTFANTWESSVKHLFVNSKFAVFSSYFAQFCKFRIFLQRVLNHSSRLLGF